MEHITPETRLECFKLALNEFGKPEEMDSLSYVNLLLLISGALVRFIGGDLSARCEPASGEEKPFIGGDLSARCEPAPGEKKSTEDSPSSDIEMVSIHPADLERLRLFKGGWGQVYEVVRCEIRGKTDRDVAYHTKNILDRLKPHFSPIS